jgi:germacradienol/geosmin synthase
MGMLAAEVDLSRLAVWDEASFDATDFGLFVAYAHADAPAPILDLLCDWYVWLFYIDDAINEIYLDQGMAEVKRFVAGIVELVPTDPASSAASRPDGPSNPAERGAVDLWPRTTPTMPPPWLERFAGHLLDSLHEMRWTQANEAQGRMPNPIEFVESRRVFGAMLWAADLIELGCSFELDGTVVALRPIRLLREAFADALCLRNDLISSARRSRAARQPATASPSSRTSSAATSDRRPRSSTTSTGPGSASSTTSQPPTYPR